MAIEIKEMVINTSVDSLVKPTFGNNHNIDIVQMKKEIVKECMEKFKEHLQRQTQR